MFLFFFLTPSQPAAATSEPQTNGHQNHDLRHQHGRPAQEPTAPSNSGAHDRDQHQEAAQQQAQSQAGAGTGVDRGVDLKQHSGQSQEDATASRQLVDALFAVLQQPLLASTCLWQVGWLLSQLLVHAQLTTSQLIPHHQNQLDQVRANEPLGSCPPPPPPPPLALMCTMGTPEPIGPCLTLPRRTHTRMLCETFGVPAFLLKQLHTKRRARDALVHYMA